MLGSLKINSMAQNCAPSNDKDLPPPEGLVPITALRGDSCTDHNHYAPLLQVMTITLGSFW